MPVKHLTVQQESIAFPRLGVLRKGGEKRTRTKNGKEYEIFGEDLDYFRFDTDDEDAHALFTKIYGEQPRTVRVVLPYPTMEQNFSVWQEAYTAGALQHRCDGETCVRWLDPQTNKYRSDPIPCPSLALPETDRNRCKPVGRLMVLLPDLRRLAHVIVVTHSIHDILELQRNMLAMERWRGDLRGIVWALSRKAVEISTPTEQGGRVRREKWLLFLEPVAEYAHSLLQATTSAALGGEARAALPDGRNVDVTTGEIYDAEPVREDPATDASNELPPRHEQHQDDTSERHKLIARINELWKLEQQLGGHPPIAELETNLQKLPTEKLIEFGQTIRRRVAALESGAAPTGERASHESTEVSA